MKRGITKNSYLQNWDRQRPIEVGKELEWFIGTVLSVDLKANEFQVSYEGESDVCCFTLLDDIVHVYSYLLYVPFWYRFSTVWYCSVLLTF